MLNFALKPTPIEAIKRFDFEDTTKNVFIKRDDLTGFELSGNKIRKLEYAVDEAIRLQSTMLLTCGGAQSNHCRATAALGAKLGMKVTLFLRETRDYPDANLFLDHLFGATCHFLSSTATGDDMLVAMESYKTALEASGQKPYIIPMGASNGIGALGYRAAFDEILDFENQTGMTFDAIVSAVGSGGTFAGLLLGQMKYNHPAHHIGFAVSGTSDYFNKRILDIIKEAIPYLPDAEKGLTPPAFTLSDDYTGPGYGLAETPIYDLIKNLAKSEGFLLDPVYTGKAFYGLVSELHLGILEPYKNILFIHTGGALGLFPHKEHFHFTNKSL
jgi:D-cysteine desulfhydrase